MFSHGTFNTIFAALLAAAAVASDGIRSASADTAPVCGVGNGPLCKTVAVELCVRWVWTSATAGLTGGGGGTSCGQWEKTTLYYYWNTGSGDGTKSGLY